MNVFVQLETLVDQCETIAVAAKAWVEGGGKGRRYGALPVPTFASDTDIARLDKAEELLRFVELIHRFNLNAKFRAEADQTDGQDYIMSRAAVTALWAYDLFLKIAAELGWTPKQLLAANELGGLFGCATTGANRVEKSDLPEPSNLLITGKPSSH
jgi:hypothetical protein